MKMTDLKREHFAQGQTFSQKTLDSYLKARAQASHDLITRYALWLVIGVAAGVALSLFLDGLLKVLLPMICVMAGALIGTRMTSASMENLRTLAGQIRLTGKDIRAAKKHLKNGTTAWTDKTGR